MLTLILMRHAKSDWDDPLASDFDRVLNARGRRNAATMGAWLARREYIPKAALVSSSARTMETYERVCAAGGFAPTLHATKNLYHPSDFSILRTLSTAVEDTVLLISHNPGIGDFASHLAKKPFAHRDFLRFPTAATAVFRIDAPEWSRVSFGMGDVVDFDIPRHLEDQKS